MSVRRHYCKRYAEWHAAQLWVTCASAANTGLMSLDCCVLAASFANALAASCIVKPSLRISSGMCSAIAAAIADVSVPWLGLQAAAPGDSRPSRVSAIAAAFVLSPAESAATMPLSATRWPRMLLNMCFRMAGGKSTSCRLSAYLRHHGHGHRVVLGPHRHSHHEGPGHRYQDMFSKKTHFVRSSCLLKLLRSPALAAARRPDFAMAGYFISMQTLAICCCKFSPPQDGHAGMSADRTRSSKSVLQSWQ